MAELKCGVDSCIYNKESLCAKGDIMVGGKNACTCSDTCCESFSQKREGHESFTSALDHPSITISIDCEAGSCTYNQNYKCSAGRVDITGCGACNPAQTSCATFEQK